MTFTVITTIRHRCYRLVPNPGGFRVINSLPMFLPDLPWSFQWKARGNLPTLRKLIDDMLRGEMMAFREAENRNELDEVVYHPCEGRPVGDQRNIELRATQLFDTLMLRDKLDVPLWGRMRFITDKSRLVPVEFIMALAAHADDGGRLNTKAEWKTATEQDLAEMGLRPEDVTSGMYAPKTSGGGSTAVAEGEEGKVYPEDEISRREGPRWTMLVTRVGAPRPYYCRRIFTTSGENLYAGTAWSAGGPWTDHVRDNSRLMALGLRV